MADERASTPRDRFAEAQALHQRGMVERAARIYRGILRDDPGHFGALHSLGLAALQSSQPAQGVALLERAVALNPRMGAAHRNLGVGLIALNRFQEALASLDRAIALQPDDAVAYTAYGQTLWTMSRYDEALIVLDTAARLLPGDADASHNLARALRQAGRHDEALTAIEAALAARPDDRDARRTHADIARDLGRDDDALASYDRLLLSEAGDAGAHAARADILHRQAHLDEALASYAAAIALRPGDPVLFHNRATVFFDLGRYQDALQGFEHAIAASPDTPSGYVNRGNTLWRLDRIEEALLSFGQAIALDPENAEAHFFKGLCLLQSGEFIEGFALYEWRWKLAVVRGERTLAPPLWLGQEDIADKTIFLHFNQGLGDTIQFYRYAAILRARGATVVMSVQDSLRRLLSEADPAITVFGAGERPLVFDFHCPLMSLPHAIGTTVETIPAEIPYLHASPDAAAAWRGLLASMPGLKVGLVWAGDPRRGDPEGAAADRRRSIALDRYAPLGRVSGVCLISLQKGEAAKQAESPPSGMVLHDWTEDLEDFSDTAALVEALDLVITVDTSVAHLAGALGKPVWILNRYDKCWRWLRGRDDSPWYPTARLFRQTKPGDWDTVIDQVSRALADRVGQAGGGGMT